MPGRPARVDVQSVVQILSGKISALTIENAMLQVRVAELEQKLREIGAGKAESAETAVGKKKA